MEKIINMQLNLIISNTKSDNKKRKKSIKTDENMIKKPTYFTV